MKRCSLFGFTLVVIGCSPVTPVSGVPSVTATPPPPVNRFQAMKLAVENRSPWQISLEPMVGIRSGGSNSFGPPEETQPGPTKTLSKSTIGGFFGSIKGVTTRAEDGQTILIHVMATPLGGGKILRESYLAFPSSLFQGSPDTITLHADSKGIQTGGVYRSEVSWNMP